ncbi:MAG: CAP domain-containing protein [Saprospiraceae bacterium]
MLKNLMFSFIFLTTSYCTNSSVVAVHNNTITKVEKEKIDENNNSQELLKLVNQLRKKGCRCGRKRMKSAPKLKLNNLLSQAALAHAKDMAAKKFFDHRGSNGSKISQRISKTGYDWQAVGENIFWGQVGIQEVFQGWKDSPSHCKNMMSQDFREMGFAKVGNYWVQDLGKRF